MNHTFILTTFLAALVVFALMLAVSLIATNKVFTSDFWLRVYRASHSKLYVGVLLVTAMVPAAMNLNYDNAPIFALGAFCWGLMDAGWVVSGASLFSLVTIAFLSSCVFIVGCFIAIAMDSYAGVKCIFQANPGLRQRT